MPCDSLDDGAIESARGAAVRRRRGVEAKVEEKRGRGLGLGLYISRRRGTCEVVNPSLRVERYGYGPGSWAAQPMYSVACLIQNNHLDLIQNWC